MTLQHLLLDATQTHELGVFLGQHLPLPTVLALCGELGAGKTSLTQGIGQGFGVAEPMTSPTFTLLNPYTGQRGQLIHLDIYRLNHPQEVWDIGLEEYLEQPHTLVVIEWADKFPTLWPPATIRLTLSHHSDGRQAALDLPEGYAMLEQALIEFFKDL